jgi:hypothetical protein
MRSSVNAAVMINIMTEGKGPFYTWRDEGKYALIPLHHRPRERKPLRRIPT